MPFCPVNQWMPRRSNVAVLRLAFGKSAGSGKSFTALVAGSIFTFSLTLGDFILPTLIAKEQFIGTVIYNDRSANLPVAAAFAMVPIAVMTVYLVVARRLGAFRAL